MRFMPKFDKNWVGRTMLSKQKKVNNGFNPSDAKRTKISSYTRANFMALGVDKSFIVRGDSLMTKKSKSAWSLSTPLSNEEALALLEDVKHFFEDEDNHKEISLWSNTVGDGLGVNAG